eukprot:jgi/Mesen1/5155/ME000255S04116
MSREADDSEQQLG